MGILIAGQLFGALSFTSEEKIMRIYPDLDPLILIGYEGLFQTMIWAILLPLFQII